MIREVTDRQYALGLVPKDVPNPMARPPMIRPDAVWIEPGQGGFCFLLAVVIACEFGVLAWQLFWR